MIKITQMADTLCVCNECGHQNSIVSDEHEQKIFRVNIGTGVFMNCNYLCGKCLFRLVNESWRYLFKPEYFNYAVK